MRFKVFAQAVGEQLLQCFAFDVWPDVVPALQQLKERKLKLCFCSNMTEEMLRQGVKNAGIDSYFDHIISTDKIKTYKQDPRAYQLCMDTLKLRKEEILFVAFAGWDVAGAKWFGYPTYWVDRLGATAESWMRGRMVWVLDCEIWLSL